MQSAQKQTSITKVSKEIVSQNEDFLAIEEPLEIRLEFGPEGDRCIQNISVTMRTPGNDAELATGFLFTEGVLKSPEEVASVEHLYIACSENKENIILVSLKPGVVPHLQNTARNFYTTSSCGVCGKGSINAIRTVKSPSLVKKDIFLNSNLLFELPDRLRIQQAIFADTGGLHAAAIFNDQGDILLLREDVGRHNALDKLIGAAMIRQDFDLSQSILLLSGRASFELIQKAAMAGIAIIAAVGAPSSLAVELALEFHITLAGFVRDNRFNIYTSPHRIIIPTYENTN